jgi:hypothetical protein
MTTSTNKLSLPLKACELEQQVVVTQEAFGIGSDVFVEIGSLQNRMYGIDWCAEGIIRRGYHVSGVTASCCVQEGLRSARLILHNARKSYQ